jgi:DNA helicase-2/ATP-dependent DNA helicase PcrA
MKLSEKQNKIVGHIDGPILVKAGPGSGKTRVLTERIRHLLSVKKRGKILALTFSNMAADEMRSRLEDSLAIIDSIDRVTIETIHSFCLEIVRSRGNLVGLRPDISLFDSDGDRVVVLRSVLSDDVRFEMMLRKQENPEAFLYKCLSSISEQKRYLVSPKHCGLESPFPEIYQMYNEVLANQNAMDFDDILIYAHRILVENPSVARVYKSVYHYISIDESQDLNYAQYQVIKALCGTDFKNVMMVGDENQSIYAFNGSSSSYMSEYFINDFKPDIYKLDENFRSAKQIIEFSGTISGEMEDTSKYFYDGEVSFVSYGTESEEAQSVCETIKKLMKYGHMDIENPLEYDDIAVIARNKYVFAKMEEELTAKQIPFYFKKTKSGINCETDHMEAFDLVLRLLMNPMDYHHRQTLCEITRKSNNEPGDSTEIKEIIGQILANSKFMWLRSILPLISLDGILDFDSVLTALKSNMPSEPIIPGFDIDNEKYLLEKDIDEWKQHWIKFKNRVSRENRSLVSFRSAISLGKTQDSEADSGIALLTAHMAKGLEFEVVFIIGLAEGIFPDYRAVKSGGEALEQEKNNMYVAVTRAKRLCYMSYPEIRRMPLGEKRKQSPSRYISKSLKL